MPNITLGKFISSHRDLSLQSAHVSNLFQQPITVPLHDGFTNQRVGSDSIGLFAIREHLSSNSYATIYDWTTPGETALRHFDWPIARVVRRILEKERAQMTGTTRTSAVNAWHFHNNIKATSSCTRDNILWNIERVDLEQQGWRDFRLAARFYNGISGRGALAR
jgi:hypothetical protein